MKKYIIEEEDLRNLVKKSWKYTMIDDLGIDGIYESIQEITEDDITEYIDEQFKEEIE